VTFHHERQICTGNPDRKAIMMIFTAVMVPALGLAGPTSSRSQADHPATITSKRLTWRQPIIPMTIGQVKLMAGFETLLDRIVDDMRSGDGADSNGTEKSGRKALPKTAFQAAVRGLQGHCPSCGEGRMFPRLLKPVEHCPLCGQDWTAQQADDFPAYVAIILTGHIMAPVIIFMVNETGFSMWTNLAIIICLALILIAALLQPAKGAIIALQWWMGLNGFEKPARPDEGLESDNRKNRP